MNNATIIVCEDDEAFHSMLVQVLEPAGFRVLSAYDGKKALELARSTRADLLLLDVNLPDIDGTQVCKMLKSDDATKQLPVIMLTTRNQTSDVVLGLDCGADDYITKPVVPPVLLARIQAVLRRTKPGALEQSELTSGGITLDSKKRSCTVEGTLVHLPPKEFDILWTLMKKPGEVFTREQLLSGIWGYSFFGTTRTLDTTIGRLRKRLGKAARHIETVQTIGFRFTS